MGRSWGGKQPMLWVDPFPMTAQFSNSNGGMARSFSSLHGTSGNGLEVRRSQYVRRYPTRETSRKWNLLPVPTTTSKARTWPNACESILRMSARSW